MRISATLTTPSGRTASPAMRLALDAITVGAMRSRRVARRVAILEMLSHPERMDLIIPGLSALEPGAANDLLREFRLDPFRQLRVHPRTLQAALVSARLVCWLKLHRPDCLALLMHFRMAAHQNAGGL